MLMVLGVSCQEKQTVEQHFEHNDYSIVDLALSKKYTILDVRQDTVEFIFKENVYYGIQDDNMKIKRVRYVGRRY